MAPQPAVASQPTKAELIVENEGEPLRFQFNPAELTIAKTNTWRSARAKGKNAPRLRFQQGEAGTLAFSALFDTTDSGDDVTRQTDRLLNLMHTNHGLPGSDRKSNRARPPWVQFQWGELRSFKAIVDSLSISFTYFASNGKALRAKADVTLKQYEDEDGYPLQNPTSSTPNPQGFHRVQPGETLDRIAGKLYGDPLRWRLIADANGVLDPLVVPPGTQLLVPEPEVVRRDR